MNLLATVVQGTQFLQAHNKVENFQLVGSAVYAHDPKDVDFLVLVEGDDISDVLDEFDGYSPCGEYDDDGSWAAIRSGDINLIVTVDPEWYERAALANEVCHALRLQDKKDRIIAYRVIRDGLSAEKAREVA